MMDGYSSPLATRYAAKKIQRVFSSSNKYTIWRKLWSALASSQEELGFSVSKEQVAELEANINNIDFEAVARYEDETRHEVMAHIRAYGDVCPTARPIIHLGATSAYVMDNGDILQYVEGLELIKSQLVHIIRELRRQAKAWKSLPVLGYTHFQPAQLTTLGKRICLWLQDFLWDLKSLSQLIARIPLLGMKGATGTQASLLALCKGDKETVQKLDAIIARKLGLSGVLVIAGQTYTRKIDSEIYKILSSISESASKFAHDMRLMQHLGEVLEPFRGRQVGSSAMPYKRNPMACERICAISRFVISLSSNGAFTAATQWLERSLDDSANKRIAIPQAFLAVDGVLHHVYNVVKGFDVIEGTIRANIDRNLPFIATENLLMAAVNAGGDRQEMHENIRVHSIAANERIQNGARDNDLLLRLASDPAFNSIKDLLGKPLLPIEFVGLAPEQVDSFIEDEVDPAISGLEPAFPWDSKIKV